MVNILPKSPKYDMIRSKSKNMKKDKLPSFFQSLFWWCDASKLDPARDIRNILVQTINYGDLEHWRWILQRYGKERIRRLLREIPMSEFGRSSLLLAMLIFGVKKMKYASRSSYIRSQKTLAKA
jgi:hypothetical protein